ERLTFPPRLEIRQKSPDFHIPTAPTATLTSQLPKRLHILTPPKQIQPSGSFYLKACNWDTGDCLALCLSSPAVP
ncbi:MAG: hypothetical protein ABSH44_25350, partial [Bryobacteraceae bacterium]